MDTNKNSCDSAGIAETHPNNQQVSKISMVRNVMSQCFAVLSFCIVKFSCGTCIGFTTLLLSELKNDTEIPMTKLDTSLFAAYCFTSPAGAIITALLAHFIGSKITLVIGAFFFSISWILFYYAKSAVILLIAQAIIGVDISLILGPGVAYIIEISQSNFRSTFMAITNLSMIMGQFFTIFLSNWLSWRNITLVNFAVSITGLISISFVPDSPHWLASKGKYEKAERSLAWLRGWTSKQNVQSEFRVLKESQLKHTEAPVNRLTREHRFADYFEPFMHKSFILPLASVCLLFFMHTLSGSHTVQTFAMKIFQKLEAPIDNKVAGSIFSALRVVGATTCIFTVHLLGRRKLMFFSLSTGALTYLTVAVFIHLTTHKYLTEKFYFYVPQVMIIVSTFVFSAGFDKVINMLNGELFPTRFRYLGTGFGSFISAVFSEVTHFSFLYIVDFITIQGVFLFFAIMSVVSFVVLYRVIPETEGKTLMEIEQFYTQASGLHDIKIKKSSEDSKQKHGVAQGV